MVKSDKLELPKLIRIPSVNLISARDFQTFQVVSSGTYYTLPVRYATKLYKSIGLKDFQFVKTLYEIKPEYAISLISDKLLQTRYNVYVVENTNHMLFLSKSVFSILSEFVKLTLCFSKFFIFFSENHSRLVYLIFNQAGFGIYFHADLINETVRIYSVQDVNQMLLLNYYSEISFTDPLAVNIIKEIFSSYNQNNISEFFLNIENIKLTWYEIGKQFKLLKQKFSDSDMEELTKLNDFQKTIRFSGYTVRDVFQKIHEGVGSAHLNFFESIYDKVQEEDLVWFFQDR